jgi:hypothetical protein
MMLNSYSVSKFQSSSSINESNNQTKSALSYDIHNKFIIIRPIVNGIIRSNLLLHTLILITLKVPNSSLDIDSILNNIELVC